MTFHLAPYTCEVCFSSAFIMRVLSLSAALVALLLVDAVIRDRVRVKPSGRFDEFAVIKPIHTL